MSNIIGELLLRVAKAAFAGVVALILYLVLVGPGGQPGSATLALLCWLSGAAFTLLVESSPI